MDCSLPALEAAINHWRERKPAGGADNALSPEVSTLASVYALMIYHHRSSIDTNSLDPYPRGLIEAALHP